MTLIQSLLLGLVEGLTEFLPISSTAHLIITSKLLEISPSQLLNTFEIIVQGGTILAILTLYLKKILLSPKLIFKIVVSFLPTAIVGLILHKTFTDTFLNSLPLTIGMLVLGGIFMIFWDYLNVFSQSKITHIDQFTFKQVFLIGLFQSLAILPGVSRAAASIATALILGADRKSAIEWSFLLALPTLAGATAIALVDTNPTLLISNLNLIIPSTLLALLTALLTIKFFLRWSSSLPWKAFGIYRIILGLLMLLKI